MMEQIETEKEYQYTVAAIEKYLMKGFNSLTEEEDRELGRLSKKVNEYEQLHFPMPLPDEDRS